MTLNQELKEKIITIPICALSSSDIIHYHCSIKTTKFFIVIGNVTLQFNNSFLLYLHDVNNVFVYNLKHEFDLDFK